MSMTLIIWFFQPNYATHIFSQPYQKQSGFDTNWSFYYFKKENACKMIQWRPKIKIHIQITWKQFEINTLKLSLVWQHKLMFLTHTLQYKANTPYHTWVKGIKKSHSNSSQACTKSLDLGLHELLQQKLLNM